MHVGVFSHASFSQAAEIRWRLRQPIAVHIEGMRLYFKPGGRFQRDRGLSGLRSDAG
jgi:hypothetical protein